MIDQAYLLAALIFVLSLLVLKIFKSYLVKHFKSLAKKTKNDIDDAFVEFIEGIHWPFLVFAAFYFATKSLTLTPLIHKVMDYMIIILAVFYLIKGITKVIDFITQKQIEKIEKEDGGETSTIKVMSIILKITIWVLAILLILSNFGINITSLLAGVGIGGIAIAFALQKILEDIFSSFTIYFDKPFKEGDYIVIGKDSGTVKHIGLKTTRIQHLKGQELVVSNRELTSTRIHNYKKMQERRVVFSLGVEYNTSSVKLEKIPDIITKIFTKINQAKLDRVHFKKFGDFALIIEVAYYVETRKYNVYMDIQQQINLQIKKQFEKEKIKFAYPTQTIHLKK